MKNFKIPVAIIAVILILTAIWLIDNTRVVEEASEEVIKIAKEKDGENITGSFYAYSIEQSDEKIQMTLYGALESIKVVWTFNLKDGVVYTTDWERHYSTKLQAITSTENITNKTVKGNIVYGTSDVLNAEIGKKAEILLLELETTYGKNLKKI